MISYKGVRISNNIRSIHMAISLESESFLILQYIQLQVSRMKEESSVHFFIFEEKKKEIKKNSNFQVYSELHRGLIVVIITMTVDAFCHRSVTPFFTCFKTVTKSNHSNKVREYGSGQQIAMKKRIKLLMDERAFISNTVMLRKNAV